MSTALASAGLLSERDFLLETKKGLASSQGGLGLFTEITFNTRGQRTTLHSYGLFAKLSSLYHGYSNLNPGQDTREQATKRTHERRHESTQEGTHQRKTNQPTNQPHARNHGQPTPPSLTRSAPELVGRQDPRLRELHRQL